MYKKLSVLLALTTIGLSVVCAIQNQKLRARSEQARATAEALKAETEARQAQVARLKEVERNEARLEKQVEDFTKVTTSLRATESSQASNLTAMSKQVAAVRKGGAAGGASTEGGFGKGMGEMLGKMMKDPAMREMMREQQKATMNMMYAGLFKDLKLSPEEKDKFKELLGDVQMRNVEAAQGMFGDKKDAASVASAEVTKKEIEKANKQTEDQIKSLLGDERFAEYTDYKKNISERMQLDQLGTKLSAANMALDDQQKGQLLQIMKDEKAAVPPVFPSDPNEATQKMQSLMTQDNVEKQLKWMEDYNRRVADKAMLVLSPEQFKEYKDHLDQQASMQKIGLQMARQMFSKENTAEPAK
jgi:hypothetical protein